MVVTPSPTGSDFKYKVIDGVSRLAIAKSLGCESVPCIIVEDTSEEALLRIGLNTTRVKSKFEYFLELDELKKLFNFEMVNVHPLPPLEWSRRSGPSLVPSRPNHPSRYRR
jgi:hypothetical protein